MSYRREDQSFIEMLRAINARLDVLENGGSRAKRNDIKLGGLMVGTDRATGKVKVVNNRTGDTTLLGKDEDAKWSYAGELEFTDYNDSPPHVMSTTLTAIEIVISLAAPVLEDVYIDVTFRAVENSGTAAGGSLIHAVLPAGKNVWITPINIPCPKNSIVYSTLIEYLGTDVPRDLSIFVRFGSPQATKLTVGGSTHYGEYAAASSDGGGSGNGGTDGGGTDGGTGGDGGGVDPGGEDGGGGGGTGAITGDLIPPDGKCWFGACASAVNVQSGTTQLGYDQLKSVMGGKRCDAYHWYYKGGGWSGYPNASERAILVTPTHEAIAFYNWKPNPSASMAEIADGAADSFIDTVSEGLIRWGKPMWLALQHEHDNDFKPNHPTAQQQSDYRDMFAHVVDRFNDNGVTNVQYVWNVTGFAKWGVDYAGLYPGDEWVDWIAYDPYGMNSATTIHDFLNEPGSGWPGFYSWATTPRADFTGLKPIMTGEWGITLGSGGHSDAQAISIFNAMGPGLDASYPQIKAMFYWNSLTDAGNYQITQPSLAASVKTAFANMANHSTFDLNTADYL